MPGNIIFRSGTILSYAPQLSGTGSALTNTSIVQVASDLYNTGVSGAISFFGTVELLTSASGFGGAVKNTDNIELYMVPARDGTNAAMASTSGVGLNYFKGLFVSPISGQPTLLRMTIDGIPLLPMRYQLWIKNSAGQTLTSGWSMFLDTVEEAYT